MASVTANELCKECQILVSNISCKPGLGLLRHHLTLESLERSSKNACGICMELLRSLKDAFASKTLDPLEIFPISCEFDTSSASWQASFEMNFVSSEQGRGDFSVRFFLEVVENSESEWYYNTDPSGGRSPRSKGQLVKYTPSSSTDSPQSWDLIGRWLTHCTQHHIRCNAAVLKSWVPTRLLDLGTSDDSLIRLLCRDETLTLSNERYATLSHCWGRMPPIQTTQRNIQRHQLEIPYWQLPPTFLDAIKVARNLHIRYLWIDSLCIVQGDREDWAHEASLMSKVYRHSFINIAATGSNSSAGGCFWKRDERTILPTEVHIQWRNNWHDCNEEAAKIKYRVVLDADVWTRKLTDEPMNKRGWILQERILSPRVLHFGHEQLFWECREFVACETYPLGLPTALQSHSLINIKRLQLGDESKETRWPARYTSKVSKEISRARQLWYDFTAIFRPIAVQETTLHAGQNNTSVYQDWYAVVELYSLGNLTYAKDKLVALSGIAQTIVTIGSTEVGDGYLAGIWQSSLPASLLWQPTYTGATVSYREFDHEYIAPTWSWASMDGHISFTSCQVNYKSEDYLAILEDAAVSYYGPYRFGQVTSGFVKISGPMASVLWRNRGRPSTADALTQYQQSQMRRITNVFPSNLTRHSSVEIDTAGPLSIGEIQLDISMDGMPEDIELTLLCIVGTKESNGYIGMVRGLVLQCSSQEEAYARIGVFMTRRPRLMRILRNMPHQSVTIK